VDIEGILVGIDAKVNSFETHYRQEIYRSSVLAQQVFVCVKHCYEREVRFHMTGSDGDRGLTDMSVPRQTAALDCGSCLVLRMKRFWEIALCRVVGR
jgi:hypothetical protein